MAVSNRFRWTRNTTHNGREPTVKVKSSDSAFSIQSAHDSLTANVVHPKSEDRKSDLWSLDDLKRLLTELQDEDFNHAIQMRRLRQEE